MKRLPAHPKYKMDTKVTKGCTKGTKDGLARAARLAVFVRFRLRHRLRRTSRGDFVPFVSVSYFFAVPPSSIARKMAFITILAAAGGFITAPLESMAGFVL